MRVLLDTCVLADLRKPDGHPAVKALVASIADDDLYISGLSLGEVARGVSSLPSGRKQRNLRAWLAGLQDRFADRILGVDHETTQLWGEIVERTHRTGHLLHMVDGLLAATALCRGLHIMTRTTPSLAATGVLIVDPYADSATSQNI